MIVKSAGDRRLARSATAAAPRLARAATLGAALVATALVSAFTAAAATGPTPPGQDSFYRYSRPLGKIAPGTVLRTRTVAVTGVSVPVTATQILYRTSGELGQPTVTVTTLLRSTASALTPTRIVSISRHTTHSARNAIRLTPCRGAVRRATSPARSSSSSPAT